MSISNKKSKIRYQNAYQNCTFQTAVPKEEKQKKANSKDHFSANASSFMRTLNMNGITKHELFNEYKAIDPANASFLNQQLNNHGIEEALFRTLRCAMRLYKWDPLMDAIYAALKLKYKKRKNKNTKCSVSTDSLQRSCPIPNFLDDDDEDDIVDGIGELNIGNSDDEGYNENMVNVKPKLRMSKKRYRWNRNGHSKVKNNSKLKINSKQNKFKTKFKKKYKSKRKFK
eukprot:4107_1